MAIGSIITASRSGTVVQVEESGKDYQFPNNLVVIKHNDGTFAQYMHLTMNGALVEIGATVSKGDTIGISGATAILIYILW
jgi:murein DD-endopeptidase MepM/ murein hydrolase activator NlpD